MEATITGHLNGKLLVKDRKFLKQNIGRTFQCKRHNINYVLLFKQNVLCHVYDCTITEG